MNIWEMLGMTAGKAVAEPIKEVGNALDKVFTSDDEKLAWLNKAREIDKEIRLSSDKIDTTVIQGQVDINKLDAVSQNKFQSSWRPLCGYICCGALAWSYILHPILIFCFNIFGIQTMHIESDIGNLTAILVTMLGLGGYRTYEKVYGAK